jgi:hypothetical protein
MTRTLAVRAAARFCAVLTIALTTGLLPQPAGAQTDDTNGQSAGAQLGPLSVKPSVGWQTEYNDNVFRSALRPVSDIVSTFGGKADVRGQMRRLMMTASGSADWVHYATLASERGANVNSALRLDLLFNRLVPYVTTAYDNTRVRVNPEIDLRPRIEQSSVGAGAVLHVGGKTSLDFSARRYTMSFDKTNVNGVSLRRALDRSSDYFGMVLMQEVTPLTRILVSAEQQRERYDEAVFRGSDNTRFLAGFESGGRIRGRARAGLRINKPRDPALPESHGFLIGVGTTMTLADRLQIGIDADRDLAPSYRPDIAYYESYSYGASVSYAIRRSVRVLAQAGQRIADYRSGTGEALSLELAGVEHETRYGTGVSYLLGNSLSIDFSGSYTERSSPADLRQFDGLSFTAGVSHAF